MEKPAENVFWGLVVEQGKQYKQTPKFNFHVSMAVLDLKTADNEPVSVNVQVENGEFILCNLTKSQPQVQLDLIFSEGEKIKFYTAGGKGNVHMTGYVMPEDDLADMMEDDEFSDEEVSIDSDLVEPVGGKRKNTETLKLAGKEAKKLKTNDKPVESKQKVVDVDPKQLLNSNKKQDNKVEQKKPQQQASQQKKPQPNAKLATKDLEVDSDDDLSVDEDEDSVDLNNLNKLVDEDESDLDDLNDEDLESDDDDLESDDEEDLAKLKQLKNKVAKPNQQANNKQVAAGGQQKKPFEKFNQGKPNQQGNKQNGQQFNKFQHNKSPQNQNKGNPNNSFNKNFQKQTPFNKNQHGNNSNKKGGTPFQHNNKNKSFGSNNKPKKVFT